MNKFFLTLTLWSMATLLTHANQTPVLAYKTKFTVSN